jgi:nucleotide-binding universal stress UspA family protein
MGRRGINVSFEHGLLGSTTEGVIRKAPKPVMVVSEKFEVMSKPLLVYDGSFSSSRVMRTAAEFVKVLGLPLTVLTTAKDKGEKYLKEAEEYLKPYDLKVDYQTVENKDPENIVEYVEKELYDLLFLGTSSHSRIVEKVLGSTTEFILRNLEKPIVIER